MGTANRKKAIVYVRVSSKEQEKGGFSIPAQMSLLEDYSVRNNIEIVRVFKEAETAKKAGRKEFEKMISYVLGEGDVNTILVEKTDRLYRNIKDWTRLDYEALNLEIHLVKEGSILSNNSNSNQKFIHGMKVLMAKNYIDNLSEEVKKGQAEKLKRGILPGKAPIGYLNKLDDHTIVVDEKTGPIIRKAFQMASTGAYSLSRLKKELFSFGIRGPRSGRELAKSQMRRILSNTFYYGVITYGGKPYKGSHEPLIDEALFNKVQGVLGFSAKPSMSKHSFAFRGPLTCAHCGCQITAEVKKKPSGKKYTYYHCTNGKKICSNVSYIREEKIEESYLKAFDLIRIPEKIIEFTRETLLGGHLEEKRYREARVSSLTARYKKIEGYIDSLYVDKLEGIIELTFWESKTSEYKKEQEQILKEIEAIKSSNTAYMLEGIKLMEIAGKASSLFPFMTTDEKREMINLVLSNPRIEDSSIRYDYKKPFNMFVGVTSLREWRERRASDFKEVFTNNSNNL